MRKTSAYIDFTIEERILQEVKKINKLLKNIDTKTRKAVSSLIKNAAFMSVTLEDLQKNMNKNGVVSEYQNGENQWGTKESPEVKIYNTMIKNYASVMKQLTDLLPKPKGNGNGDDGFADFVNSKNE